VAPTAQQADRQPADWPAALRQVFAERWRVRPAFQPIIDLERGSVWGFQVLARFISPLRATPPEWLRAAEDLGLRQALETRLLGAGLQALAEVPERCRLLLPLSPATLLDHGIEKELAKHVRVMRHVVLDLAAGGPAVEVADIVDAVAPLRRDGGRIAVTAGSSPGGLDALPRLRPEVLKVGRDFVAGLESDAARQAVVDGLVQLVGALGGRVLAVGVEDQGELDALGEAGITLAQGFGLGRPVPSMATSVTRASAPLLNR
jgi:EAL domain-containing protein (putative c-di-GMP-specific phosphodiesterase class I)